MTYLGYNGDGHFGRLEPDRLGATTRSATTSASRSPAAKADIRAGFAAAELSRDFDWIRAARCRRSSPAATRIPFDDDERRASTRSSRTRCSPAPTPASGSGRAIPLIGGGGVALSGRNGVLPSLRSSKEQGQSNFVNPGLLLLGVGADFDVTPQLRLIGNVNYLCFADTAVLDVLRNQRRIDNEIGWDVSVAAIWRPFMTQNVVLTAVRRAALIPGEGFKQLYDDERRDGRLLLDARATSMLTY